MKSLFFFTPIKGLINPGPLVAGGDTDSAFLLRTKGDFKTL